MIINVQEVHVETDPSTRVWNVVILDDKEKASWNETFNTETQLSAFLHGIKVAYAMREENPVLLPDCGKPDGSQPVKFASESCVDMLP